MYDCEEWGRYPSMMIRDASFGSSWGGGMVRIRRGGVGVLGDSGTTQ